MDQLREFLDTILYGKPDDTWVLVWVVTANSKISHWAQSNSEIAKLIEDNNVPGRHVYIGCGWSEKTYGKNLRVKSNEVSGIPGLWCDLDVGDVGHNKSNLPPTIEDVLDAIHPYVPAPTLIINSGHGVHIWWLFNQPWIFEDDQDRKNAASLSKAWQSYIQSLIKAHGWTADTTSDLARVLRPAGTVNYKDKENPVPVEVIEDEGERFDPEQFRQWIATHSTDDVQVLAPTERLEGQFNFSLDASASPPVDKWMILQEVDYRVKQSWDHKRRDIQDQSQSGYDQSLATFAANAHWSDQEIIDLLVANRRFHGVDLLLENRNYYERTLKTARKGDTFVFTKEEQKIMEKVTAPDSEVAKEPLTDDEKSGLIALISRKLDIGDVPITEISRNGTDKEHIQMVPALTGILCYTKDPPVYYVELYNAEGDKKRVRIGDGNDVRDQKKWSRLIYDERQRDIVEYKKAEWMVVRGMITRAIERVSPGIEGSEAGTVQMWIQEFAGSDVKVIDWNDKDRWIRDGKAFICRGLMYFMVSPLLTWLRTNRGKNVDHMEMVVYLKIVGARSKTVHFKPRHDRNDRTTTTLWYIKYGDDAEIEDTDEVQSMEEF
jgi:hypothetical protein